MTRVSNSEVMKRFRMIDEIEDPEQVKKIQDQLVKDLAFLVYSNTKRYMKFSNYEDLNQEGFIGLLKAVRRFDHTLFPNFFVYANQWIINSIRRSAKKFDIVYNPQKIKAVYCGDENMPIEDDYGDGPDDFIYRKEKMKKVQEELNRLTEREKKILCNLFGMNGLPQTLRGAGKVHGLTYERIRQIKNEILDSLRSNNNLSEINE